MKITKKYSGTVALCALFALLTACEFVFAYSAASRIALVLFVAAVFLVTRKVRWSVFLTAFTAFLLLSGMNMLTGHAVNAKVAGSMSWTLCLNLLFFAALTGFYDYLGNGMTALQLFKWVVLGASALCLPIGIYANLSTGQRVVEILGINANMIAMMAAYGSLIQIHELLETKQTQKRVLGIAMLAVMLAMVVVSGSRKGLLIPLIGFYVLVCFRRPRKALLYTAVGLAAAGMVVFLLLKVDVLYSMIGYRVEAVFQYLAGGDFQESSLVNRDLLIRLGWTESQNSPFWGHGLDCFRLLPGSKGVYSHNNFVEILYSLGWTGLVIWYLPFLWGLLCLPGAAKKDRQGTALAAAILIPFLLCDYMNVTYYTRLILILPVMLLRQTEKNSGETRLGRLLQNPYRLFSALAARHMFDRLRDKTYISLMYRSQIGKWPDLKHPRTFNEKLQWLKLYHRDPRYTLLSDKVQVREFVAETVGEEHLVPLLGVWDDPEKIDFDALPRQFVLKCNHNSGLGMCICKDKGALDIAKVKADLKRGLEEDYSVFGREWPYKDIPRKILAEAYLGEVDDIKVLCFHGQAKCSFVCSGRFEKEGMHVTFFDRDWNRMDMRRVYPALEGYPKPLQYEKMVTLAEKLTQEIPFARVDFYEVEGKVYIGEITFFPGSGWEAFTPEKWDETLGQWLTLPEADAE